MNLEAIKFLIKIMETFNHSFINGIYELILIPQTNLYFRLEDVRTVLDLKCKLLEYCSRDCYKTQPFNSKPKNKIYNQKVLENINKILETNFNFDDMNIIYTKLGNCCHHQLTVKFIESDYDLNILIKEMREIK